MLSRNSRICGSAFGSSPDGVIGEDEFSEFLVPECALRLERRLGKAGRLRVGVGIEGGLRHGAAAWPEPAAADLVGIGLPHHPIADMRGRARMGGRGAAGEAGHGQVEAAPEEMHRTDLADEARAEQGEDAIALDEDAPEAVGIVAIIGRMGSILLERDRVGDLDRHGPDLHDDSQGLQLGHEIAIEIGDRARLQGHVGGPAFARGDHETMVDEIEVDLKAEGTVGHRRGGQPAGGHIERHLPPVIDQRGLGQADLADDLSPKLQRRASVPPFGQGQARPDFFALCHRHLASPGRLDRRSRHSMPGRPEAIDLCSASQFSSVHPAAPSPSTAASGASWFQGQRFPRHSLED